jgi:predicted GNAT family acetyltransferase
MVEIIESDSFNDFLEYNRKFIYSNYFSHFYLIKTIERIVKIEQKVYGAFNIIDKSKTNILCIWTEGEFLIYGANYNVEIINMLYKRIQPDRYAHFYFSGQRSIILDFFSENTLQYSIYKDRLMYSCEKVIELNSKTEGSLELASLIEIDELARMGHEFYNAEYDDKADRDFEYMYNVVKASIINSTLYLWRCNNLICSIAQIVSTNNENVLIGLLYTNKDQRNKGYATALLYNLTRNLLDNGVEKCGLIADRNRIEPNKVFNKIGYVSIYEHISVYKE